MECVGSTGDGVRSAQYRVLSAEVVMLTWGLDELDGTGCPKRADQGGPATLPRHPTACDVWIYSELETRQASLERH
jgi:hypothetical protein